MIEMIDKIDIFLVEHCFMFRFMILFECGFDAPILFVLHANKWNLPSVFMQVDGKGGQRVREKRPLSSVSIIQCLEEKRKKDDVRKDDDGCFAEGFYTMFEILIRNLNLMNSFAYFSRQYKRATDMTAATQQKFERKKKKKREMCKQ